MMRRGRRGEVGLLLVFFCGFDVRLSEVCDGGLRTAVRFVVLAYDIAVRYEV